MSEWLCNVFQVISDDDTLHYIADRESLKLSNIMKEQNIQNFTTDSKIYWVTLIAS